MPFEIMDQRNTSISSRCFEDGFPAEIQVGFWKLNTMCDNQDKVVGSSPLKKFSVVSSELPPADLVRDQEEQFGSGWKGTANLSKPSRNPLNHHPISLSHLYMQSPVNFNRNNTRVNVVQHESSLFSSSFSEIFSRKLKLLGNDLSFQHANKAAPHNEEEPCKSMKEIEAQTIGNLLPDEDDLFSGVNDELGLNSHFSKGDKLEDFDLFSSGGGMELEGDDHGSMGKRNSDPFGVCKGLAGSNGSVVEHPSRTLYVRNINSNVEDSDLKALFEQYGDIRTLYTACKHCGFVMISYYDIRSAQNAMSALQNKPLKNRKLDIHYSIPKDNGSTQVFAPVNKLVEPHQSSSVPINLASPTRVTPIGAQLSLQESNHSMDEMKFANPDMASRIGPMMAEGLQNRNIRGASTNGHLMEPNAGVFGSPGNGSLPLNGNHYAWNNSNSRLQHPSSVMVLSSSPSFVNGFRANHLPQIPGYPRASPAVLNVGSPLSHHIGSAPPVNSAFWDRQHPFAGESPEASGFHLGNVGFTGSSPSHPVEIASHNFFSHVGGNCMNLTKNGGVHSPQQMCHLFPGRNPMVSMPASLDSPNGFIRNFSHRRSESNSTNADKKQYDLDIERIIRGDDSRTTLMIKNIPNKYTSKMLLAAIDEHCRGTYDFIYLPIDFKNKCNVGYAFINMIDPQQIIPFYKAFNGKKWEKFNSEKVASLAYGRIQGKAALIAHFQNSSLMNEDKRCRPILFHTYGPNAGDQEPFPIGTNIRSRVGRPRATNTEENHPTLVNGDTVDS